jgi:L-seryl-tRNA(Ser) seleniumtransferase
VATVDISLRNPTGPRNANVSHNEPNRYDIPLLTMLHTSNDELQQRAGRITAALDGLPLKVAIGRGRAQVGGGALPRSIVQSTTLEITHSQIRPEELATRLRSHTPPIIGYIERGKVKLDLRSVFAGQDDEIIAALRATI